MTVEEFLKLFETKFRAARPEVHLIRNTEWISWLALRLGPDRLCPIEWCAYVRGAFKYAGPKLGLEPDDIQALAVASDHWDPSSAVRQRLLAIVGLPPETEAQQ